MAHVVRSEVLGFCMGVRRAVDLAFAETERCKKTYTLGPLIHNPQTLDELKQRGAAQLSEDSLPADLHGSSVIIRAHGINPQTEAELRRRGANIIDATCPRVKASQLKAAEFADAGFCLFLAGEESHAEITGILGYANMIHATVVKQKSSPPLARPICIVVAGAVEAQNAAVQLYTSDAAQYGNDFRRNTALIGQTTISEDEYQAIGGAITALYPDLEIARTICAATKERQDSLRELLGRVDAVVIAGGRDSANTRRLLNIAQTSGKPCTLAETAADIPPDFFSYQTIGLAAGASTPDSVIEVIEQALKFGKN
ncbi:MAG: 4-hydroxy-3-methylbut-2-enyl diphosphate reductase [Treponema sp.]|nr:4-hydroxy-3-methylbut-2-enyl diphosphate reductase [Treponema sp.]